MISIKVLSVRVESWCNDEGGLHGIKCIEVECEKNEKVHEVTVIVEPQDLES